jgi:integrase
LPLRISMNSYSINKCLVRGDVRWRVAFAKRLGDGKVKQLYLRTREEAERAAREYLLEIEQHGVAGVMDTEHRALINRYALRMTVAEMDAALSAAIRARGRTAIHLAHAADEYEQRLTDCSSSHRANVRYRLRLLMADFPGRDLADVTPSMLDQHIRARGRSAKNQWAVLRAFYVWARLQDYVQTNPMEQITKPRSQRQTPAEQAEASRCLTPSEFKQLLDGADDKMRIHLILGGLMGMRTAEILRAQRHDLDLSHGIIHIPAMKTQARGMRERWPQLTDAAIRWLDRVQLPASGSLTGRNDSNSRIAIGDLCARTGIRWSHNILRRSFASHHLAAYTDAGKTAHILGHTSSGTTYAKYYRAIPAPVGLAWFEV